jgi:hypothetical protein
MTGNPLYDRRENNEATASIASKLGKYLQKKSKLS